jgi:hypothetical protein
MFSLSMNNVKKASAELKSVLEQSSNEDTMAEMRTTAEGLIEKAAQLETC